MGMERLAIEKAKDVILNNLNDNMSVLLLGDCPDTKLEILKDVANHYGVNVSNAHQITDILTAYSRITPRGGLSVVDYNFPCFEPENTPGAGHYAGVVASVNCPAIGESLLRHFVHDVEFQKYYIDPNF